MLSRRETGWKRFWMASFGYLGTIITRNGKIDKEISNRVQKETVIYDQLAPFVLGTLLPK